MSSQSRQQILEELIESNNTLKQVFKDNIGTKIENLMNLNTRFYLHNVSSCFKKEGLDTLSFLENKDLFDSDRPVFVDPNESINYNRLSMFNIPRLIEYTKNKSIKYQSVYPFNIKKMSKEYHENLQTPIDINKIMGINYDNIKNQSIDQKQKNHNEIFNKLFKETSDNSEAMNRIETCVKNHRENYDFQQNQYKSFLIYFENMYKDCLRNCKFEIKETFPKCCNQCQNYFYKVMVDMSESTNKKNI